MRKILISLLVLSSLAFASACVYRAPIAQGNLIKDEDIAQLELGMTRKQVRFLLGTPMVDDLFHRERWDYVYYLKVKREKARALRWLSIYFEDDRVSRIDKDLQLNPDV